VRVDGAVGLAAAVVDHQAVERGAFVGHGLGRFLFPVRVEQLLAQQVRAHLFKPLWLDVGNAPAKEARGLDQFGHHDPAARFLLEVRARVAVELDAARAQVHLLILQLAADAAQQAREHGLVQLLVAGGLGVELPAVLGHHGVQLAVRVTPFAHTAHVDEVLAQELFVLAVGQLVGRWEIGVGSRFRGAKLGL